MPKPSRTFLIAIVPLVLALAVPAAALAKGPPIKVEQADPNYAYQADMNKPIKLKGSNFPEKAAVIFYAADGNTEQVTVSSEVTLNHDTGDLEFEIDVMAQASLGDYDIEVIELSSGRKGRGTTLFSVKEKPNQNTDVFTPVEITVSYYRTLEGSMDEELEAAEPYNGPYAGPIHHPWTGTASYGDYIFTYDFDKWSANTLGGTPRPCELGAALINPPTAGRYDCFDGGSGELWPHGGLVFIPLAGMQWNNVTVAKNGRAQNEPGFCPLLNELGGEGVDGYLEFGATRYTIFFMEGCDALGGCPISIFTMSYSGVSSQQDGGGGQLVLLHPFHDLPRLPDIGRMSLTAYVNVQSPPLWPASGELNVFTEPQDLAIDKFRIQLNNVKNGGLEAICETAPGTVNNIRFRATPVP